MMTVSQVSSLTGVSARTLRYYDRIGLLAPDAVTEAGYRLYGDGALERLQQVLLFRELQFPLKDIRRILDAPGFDRNWALNQQIELLTLKKEHLENLIALAVGIRGLGVSRLDFSAFDTRKIDEYARRAKAAWGETQAYREYARKSASRDAAAQKAAAARLMAVFTGFGALLEEEPEGARAQAQVQKLRAAIDEDFYTCTPQILRSLGGMYAGDGEFAQSIDAAGGPGTAAFAARAVAVYCDRLEGDGNGAR